jgi:hypothetical protein
MRVRKNPLAIVAACVMAATIQVGTAFAQNTGVDGAGNTVLLWRATDYSISLWKIDPNFNLLNSHVYGPFLGLTPVALTTDALGFSYVLWRNTDGSIVLWLVDPNLNFIGFHAYGPFPGWTAKGLSVSTSGSPNFRVLWRRSDGFALLWNVDGGLNVVGSSIGVSIFGWDAGYTSE